MLICSGHCLKRPLNSSQQLKDFLALSFIESAQYDFPITKYVRRVCNAVDGAAESTDILGRIATGFNVSALGGIFGRSCNSIFDIQSINNSCGWAWQVLCATYVLLVQPFQYLCYVDQSCRRVQMKFS